MKLVGNIFEPPLQRAFFPQETHEPSVKEEDLKVVGHIFEPNIAPDPDPTDPVQALEASPFLYWVAAMYYQYVVHDEHGVWDSSHDDDDLDSISAHNRIQSDEDFYIQCNATDREFKVHVHPIGDIFELTDANNPSIRIVFRLLNVKPSEMSQDYGFDWTDKVRVDRVEGEKDILRHLTHLKLTGAQPSMEVVG